MSRTATPLDVIEGRAQWCVVTADCLDVLPTLPKVDAVVTDPPYGINAARDRNSRDSGWVDYPITGWDKEPASPESLLACVSAGAHATVWGGNYFAGVLGPSQCWLCWDKGQREFSLADGELAWTNENKAMRIFNLPRSVALADGKVHHTQKPVALMVWNISLFTEQNHVVLDPFCGSGTTGVACVRLGRRFIGIEKDAGYAEIARERIEAETRGLTLKAARAGQVSIFDVLDSGKK